MESWVYMVVTVMSLMTIALWILFFNYWIVNATDLVNKYLIWLYIAILSAVHIFIIWIPILVFTNPVSIAWFSLPMIFIPFAIGHWIFHFFRK